MKTFTLYSDVFVQSFENPCELIEWTFEWNGILYMNVEYWQLCVKKYSNN